MLTPVQRRQFSQAERDLDALTGRQVGALAGTLGELGPSFTVGALEALPPLVAELADVSALIGSSAYDLSREQSDASGRFTAVLADPPPGEMVQASTKWALFTPVAGAEPDRQTVTDRLTVMALRLVRDGARNTVVGSVRRDPARPMYRRVAKGGACGFCLMLSSRGAVYPSKDNAGSGKHWHDRCSCTVEPQFRGESEPPEVAALYADFSRSTRGLSGADAVRKFNQVTAERARA